MSASEFYPSEATDPIVVHPQETTQQKVDRLEPLFLRLQRRLQQRSAEKYKPFFVKVVEEKPDKYIGGEYRAYEKYKGQMEQQFNANEVDDFARNPGKAKLYFAVCYLEGTSWNQ